MQSALSWAPKVARKCESKHWYACGADGRSVARSVGHVITKSSGMGRFIYPWCSTARFAGGAPLLPFDYLRYAVIVSLSACTFPYCETEFN